MSMLKFFLPSSNMLPYSESTWEAFRSLLSKNVESRQLSNVILSQLNGNGVRDNLDAGPEYEAFLARSKAVAHTKTEWSIPSWNSVIAKRDSFTESQEQIIFSWALKMEELFPQGYLPVLEQGCDREVVLSPDQIRCLLANMLLCTLKPEKHNKFWVSFQPWLTKDTSPSVAYLSCLLKYLLEENNRGFEVRFKRLVCPTNSLPDWTNNKESLVNIKVHCPSRIGDDPNEVEIDFANKDIGFGPGGTQEEIIFGMSPEACPAVLVTPTLQDNECLLISGARRLGRSSGYNFNVNYEGVGDCLPRTILCMDALELEEDVTAKQQAKEFYLKRELLKTYTGFCGVVGQDVGTGAWGCGAFGGDREVKFAVQVVAASVAGVKSLRYRTVDHEFADKLASLLESWNKRGFTSSCIFEQLKLFAESKNHEDSFFNFVLVH